MQNTTFTLRDPRPDQVYAPYTFFLPDPRRIAAVAPGDLVKVIFVSTAKETKWEGERMWVEIFSVDESQYQGRLDNDPEDIPGLSSGDPVTFQDWHIISVDLVGGERDQKNLYPQRQYFDRCLVDRCILDDGVRVEYLYREDPDLGSEGDTFPDSGWRIRGDGRGLSNDEIDERECAYVALGAVLNRDDSWLHLIDAPEGSGFLRNWDKNVFIADPE